jgi:hypothetical protein
MKFGYVRDANRLDIRLSMTDIEQVAMLAWL